MTAAITSTMAKLDGKIDLSLIIPAHNEEGNVELFYTRACECAKKHERSCELIYIDDGSSDDTLASLNRVIEQAKQDEQLVRVISFSRNFGKESAMYAGLEHARGLHCCFIDADMQQDPDTAFEMLKTLESNPDFDCVAAYQEKRRQGFLRSFFSKKFYGTFSSSAKLEVVHNASDFRVFNRSVANALLDMPERFRFSKGLFAWVGFKTLPFAYNAGERHSGKTNWSFASLMRYALEGIFSFSTFPLHLATYAGIIASLAALIYAIFVIVQRLAFGVAVPGYATIVVLVLFLGGLQLLVLGIIGQYIARAYIEGKRRPIYVARKIISSADNLGEHLVSEHPTEKRPIEGSSTDFGERHSNS